MHRNIVVGYNDTEGSRDALALAKRLRADDGVITVVCVYADPWPGRGSQLNSVVADDARQAVSSAADEGDVKTDLAPGGSPARGLHNYAEKRQADLVVVGSSSRGAVGQVLAGTVAQRLLNGASCAVAIAPRGYAAQRGGGLRKVVVGVDGSQESELAVAEASSLARGADADLELVAVAEPPLVAYGKGAGPHEGYPELQRAIEEQTEANLRRAVDSLPEGGDAETEVRHGESAVELADAVRSEGSLLVVGSRAYGPLRRVLLGSVSGALIKAAPCPVVVVPRGAGEAGGKQDPQLHGGTVVI